MILQNTFRTRNVTTFRETAECPPFRRFIHAFNQIQFNMQSKTRTRTLCFWGSYLHRSNLIVPAFYDRRSDDRRLPRFFNSLHQLIMNISQCKLAISFMLRKCKPFLKVSFEHCSKEFTLVGLPSKHFLFTFSSQVSNKLPTHSICMGFLEHIVRKVTNGTIGYHRENSGFYPRSRHFCFTFSGYQTLLFMHSNLSGKN